MHYKNGREAKEGDSIVVNVYVGGTKRVAAGTLHSVISDPACTTCNGLIAVPIVGGVQSMTVTIGDCYHAEDAFKAIDVPQAEPEEAPVGATGKTTEVQPA